jgi:transcriptional regulator with XRE-family HTH domain
MRLNVEYLKEVIERKGWTIGQFAVKTGLSTTTISRILNGKRGAGAKSIGRIVKALPGEPLDKLFFLE